MIPLVDPLPPRCVSKVIKRIPRVCRDRAAAKLASILETVYSLNDHASWVRLLQFCSRCLRVHARGRHRRSLSAAINKLLSEEGDNTDSLFDVPLFRQGRDPSRSPLKNLTARVSSKLEEGDFKGVVRLSCSEDTFAELNAETLSALQQKHPNPHPDSSIPPSPPPRIFEVPIEEIVKAIKSFPNGSAGGPDGLRPQHVKDMTNSFEDGGHSLFLAFSSFIGLVLAGKTPPSVRPSFFGANLIPLQKKDGGVRPIAVGCTLYRLVAKVASSKVKEEMATLLAPKQLGYVVKSGIEAAIHSAHLFLNNISPLKALAKLDFKNAFNSTERQDVIFCW